MKQRHPKNKLQIISAFINDEHEIIDQLMNEPNNDIPFWDTETLVNRIEEKKYSDEGLASELIDLPLIDSAGRRPGPTKTSTDLRQWIRLFIDENTRQIQKDWQALDPKDRIVLFEKFLKYTLPTLQSIQNENHDNKEIKLTIVRTKSDHRAFE